MTVQQARQDVATKIRFTAPAGLIAMLKKNGGKRTVPTIVTGDEVQVGFKGS